MSRDARTTQSPSSVETYSYVRWVQMKMSASKVRRFVLIALTAVAGMAGLCLIKVPN